MNENTRRSQIHYWRSEENRIKHIARIKANRATRIAEGRCARCKRVREDPSRTHCKACRDKARVFSKQKRLEKALNNECTDCTRKAEEGKSRCNRCLLRHEKNARRKRARIRRNLKSDCDNQRKEE